MNSHHVLNNQILAVGFAALIAIALSGCGRANTVYVDPATTAAGTQIDVDDSLKLPDGFADQSLNDAEVTVINAGEIDSSVRLSTTETLASRAILGITKFDELALEDFAGVELTLKNNRSLKLSLQVDLNCDSSEPLRTLNATNVTTSASIEDSIWSVSGEAIENANGEELVPSTTAATNANSSGTSPASLDQLLAEYPNACLRNGKTEDADIPKFSIGAVLLSLGDGTNTTTGANDSVEIETLKIQNETYENWGTK